MLIEPLMMLPEPTAEEIEFLLWVEQLMTEATRTCGIPLALLQVENPNGCFARQEAMRFERGADRWR